MRHYEIQTAPSKCGPCRKAAQPACYISTSQVGRWDRGGQSIVIYGKRLENIMKTPVSWIPAWSNAILGMEQQLGLLWVLCKRGSRAEQHRLALAVLLINYQCSTRIHSYHACALPAQQCSLQVFVPWGAEVTGCAGTHHCCMPSYILEQSPHPYRLPDVSQSGYGKERAAHSPDRLVSDSSVSDEKKAFSLWSKDDRRWVKAG